MGLFLASLLKCISVILEGDCDNFSLMKYVIDSCPWFVRSIIFYCKTYVGLCESRAFSCIRKQMNLVAHSLINYGSKSTTTECWASNPSKWLFKVIVLDIQLSSKGTRITYDGE